MGTRKATLREVAAIRYAIAYGITSKSDIYRIAYDGSEKEISEIKSLKSVANHWWNSTKIQDLLRDEQAAYDARLQTVKDNAVTAHIQQAATAASSGAGVAVGGQIDFTLPENLQRELNRLANDPNTDLKTKLDCIKALAAFKTDEQETEESKIHRFYTPLRCTDCKLYAFARACDEANIYDRCPEMEELRQRVANEK
ncbi:MAG: hypothetical protein IKI66_04195 [Bacteroidales bacterium]|nr:hypothetical protein [Bacteroidales bacterium]